MNNEPKSDHVDTVEQFVMTDDNPFCDACKEPDCLCSNDGTCAMIRVYLSATKNKQKAAYAVVCPHCDWSGTDKDRKVESENGKNISDGVKWTCPGCGLVVHDWES